jgi:hypothetical protein
MSDPQSAAVTDLGPDQPQNPNPEQPATSPNPIYTPAELSQAYRHHEERLRRVERTVGTLAEQATALNQGMKELLQASSRNLKGTFAAPSAPDNYTQLSKALKIPTPEEYSGNKDQLDHWISTMERTFELTNVDLNSQLAVSFTSLRFKGRVQTWWASECKRTGDFKHATFQSFTELAKAMREFLEDPHSMEKAMEKLRKLKQDGSVFDYATKFFDLLHQIPHRAEQDAIYDFVQGLKGFHHQYVSQLKPTSLQLAREYALRADHTWLHNRNHTNNTSATHYHSKGSSSATPMDLSVLSHSSGRSSNTSKAGNRGRSATPGPNSRAGYRSRSSSRNSRASSSSSTASASLNTINVKELCTEPFKKLTLEENKLLTTKGICTFCRKPNHTVYDCPKRARYKSTKHSSPSSRQGK